MIDIYDSDFGFESERLTHLFTSNLQSAFKALADIGFVPMQNEDMGEVVLIGAVLDGQDLYRPIRDRKEAETILEAIARNESVTSNWWSEIELYLHLVFPRNYVADGTLVRIEDFIDRLAWRDEDHSTVQACIDDGGVPPSYAYQG